MLSPPQFDGPIFWVCTSSSNWIIRFSLHLLFVILWYIFLALDGSLVGGLGVSREGLKPSGPCGPSSYGSGAKGLFIWGWHIWVRIPDPNPPPMVWSPTPPIPHTFCARHCNETYISIFLHARRCSETHIIILLDEPSRRIRWVDRAKLWRNANFKLQELLRAVYRTFQCSANGIIYIYTYTGTYPHTYIYIHIHKNR